MTETPENTGPARRHRFIAGGAVALAVLAGGVGIAAAQTSSKPAGPRVTAQASSKSSDSGAADHKDAGDKPDATFKSLVTSPEQPDAAGN